MTGRSVRVNLCGRTIRSHRQERRRERDTSSPPQQPKLLDRVRAACRVRHFSIRTEEAYAAWVERFIRFHKIRHPNTMAEPEVNAFLTHLAVERNVAASTQNQAMAALLFLYDAVLRKPLNELNVVRANRPARLPAVMTRDEVARVLGGLKGVPGLVCRLQYGAGFACWRRCNCG